MPSALAESKQLGLINIHGAVTGLDCNQVDARAVATRLMNCDASDMEAALKRDAADGLGQTRFKRFQGYAPGLVLN